MHVTVRLPLGDMTAGQMHVLADLAEAYADGTARLTIGQNVLFRWVKVGALQELYQRLQAAGLGAAASQHRRRRRELPRGRKLPPGGDAVARAGTRR